MLLPRTTTPWSAEESATLYGVRHWGAGYFDVSPEGEVVVRPDGPDGVQVSLMDIVGALHERGLVMPMLLRFGGILGHRIQTIHQSFRKAIEGVGYKNRFQGVYPIKVNQQQQVLAEIVEHGRAFHHGLEAGSKAELIAAMAYLQDEESILVCNGYKDEEFIDLALYLQMMGMKPFLVIELPDELDLILQRAEKLGVTPMLGVRAKLATKAGGHWENSGGDRSMFGLNAAQIIDVVDRLRDLGKLDCLRMLHYHLGSQVPDIRSIRRSVTEGTRFYVDLVAEGAAMGYLNVGGGLAVDYDGSHSDQASSANYTIDEYAVDVVETVKEVTGRTGVEHPVLVTESGRATVAHHSVLLFNVLDVTRVETHALPDSLPEDAHLMLGNLMAVVEALRGDNLQECYNDATYYRDEIRSLFQHGVVSLRQRAIAERIFWVVARKIAAMVEGLEYVPEELDALRNATADVYHGNFSVFQSLPDAWAIDQLFPVMPIHRLGEEPARTGTVADITCDCDGKLDHFIDRQAGRLTLPLHDLSATDEYYLGVFLVGAYQETLGDLHNLLGDTNVVNVYVSPEGEVEYEREVAGDTVAEVLSYVEYQPGNLLDLVRTRAEQAVRRGLIAPQMRRTITEAYEAGLRGYTYFES